MAGRNNYGKRRNKGGFGIFMLPKRSGGHNYAKHHDETIHLHRPCIREPPSLRDMMSGDSSNVKYDLKETSALCCTPTSSSQKQDKGVQSGSESVEASVKVENPALNDALPKIALPDTNSNETEETIVMDEDKMKMGNGTLLKANGNADQVDSVYRMGDGKNKKGNEEDECIVNCLYYSMQCCECTIQ